jgi:hypothetical protein
MRPTDSIVAGAVNPGMAVLAGRQPSRAKGAALNYPSQPHGRALMLDVPSLASCVGPETTRVAGLREGFASR